MLLKKNVFYFFPFLLLCLYTKPAQSQADDELGSSITYPAAGNAITSPKVRAFIQLFQSENVGNLHVYAHKGTTPPNDYVFTGQPIGGSHTELFDEEHKRWLSIYQHYAFAVYSIRGDEQQYYIIRLADAKGNNRLELFELNDDQLKHNQTLASYTCEATNCMQVDSWLQDINGDTRIDIIQKSKTYSSNQSKENLIIFKQTKDGDFIQSTEMHVEKGDYKMEPITEVSMSTNK